MRLALVLSGVAWADRPSLTALYTSHGAAPVVVPGRFDYAISLAEPVASVGLVPRVNASSEAEPVAVSVSWTPSAVWQEPESSNLGVIKQIPLPEDGADLVVKIGLQQAGEQPATYTVTYKQKSPPPTGLFELEARDADGRRAILAPTLSDDVQTYSVFVEPDTKKVALSLHCRGSASALLVNGARHGSNRADVSITRESDHHSQVVDVTCRGKKRAPNDVSERHYSLVIKSDYSLAQLDQMPTQISIPQTSQTCQFNPDKLAYYCPDPQLAYHLAQIKTANNPAVKYTMFNRDRSTELRLLNNQLSIPFTYSSRFLVRHEAGRFYKDYPLYFEGGLVRSVLGLIGSLLAGLLLLLTLALLGVVGAASIWTLGFPLGATEIAGTLAFLIQYLCFSQNLKGSPRLTELTEPLRWFTLFAPGPLQVSEEDCGISGFGFNKGRIGDIRDYRNAQGAMFWGFLLFGAFVLVHASILFRFYVLEKGYTVPHHVRFGCWENRVLHALLFPMATAAAYCLASDKVCPIFKGVAGTVLGLYGLWMLFETLDVHSMVSNERVVWIWNSSVKEDGQLENESGYWADAISDQLLTQPVNRTRMQGLFPFTWVSPVADIVPITTIARPGNGGDVYGPQKYKNQNYKDANYGLAKTPQVVEVVRCRKPGGLCRGQRLIAGLFRTDWLDILFTYESLTRFHASASKPGAGGPLTIPCVAKTSQLYGPLSGGRAMFFFDGARVPFIRIADCFYRLLVGVCLGISLGGEQKHAAPCFVAITVASAAMLVYTATTKPFTRLNEGWLAVGTYATVTVSALAFAVYYLLNGNRDETTMLADLSLWALGVCCLVLGLYSLVVDSSIFAAVFCPPLDESKFLEQLSNVSVAINSGVSRVETPGYSKYPVKDILMKATKTGAARIHVSVTPSKQEPCLEFAERDLRHACQTHALPVPIATVVARSRREKFGYKYLHVVKPEAFTHSVPDFLTNDDERDAYEGSVARELAKHVQYQTETRGRGGQTLLTVNIAPPNE